MYSVNKKLELFAVIKRFVVGDTYCLSLICKNNFFLKMVNRRALQKKLFVLIQLIFIFFIYHFLTQSTFESFTINIHL